MKKLEGKGLGGRGDIYLVKTVACNASDAVGSRDGWNGRDQEKEHLVFNGDLVNS